MELCSKPEYKAQLAATRDARMRFTDYLEALNVELLSNYGPIDILWYDAEMPAESAEGLHSLERNQRLRALQPGIIINNRSHLVEDFGTPEGHITPDPGRDWEACMTYNDISWGYIDSAQAAPYSYNAARILSMLSTTTAGGGNLLLNIGPAPDGSVPAEAVEPLRTVGRWLEQNGECIYGQVQRSQYDYCSCICRVTRKGNMAYVLNLIWPSDGQMILGGFGTPLRAARLLATGEPVEFEQRGHRIVLKNLPEHSPDAILGCAVIALEFDEPPAFTVLPLCPPMHNGKKMG